jgi:hypothetical protein
MNKTTKILICGAAALLFVGCVADIQQEEPVLQRLVPINVMAAGSDGALTRAGMEVQESQFQNGETFYVRFAAGTAVDSTNTALSSTLFTTTNGNGTAAPAANSPQPFFESGAASTTLYAYYPQTVTETTTSFVVAADQTTDAAYKASDLMYAETTALKRGKAVTIPLQFEHRLAKVTIMAMAVDSVRSISAIRIISGMRGIRIADPETATPSTALSDLSDPVSATDPLLVYENADGANVIFCSAVLPPQTIQGDFLEFDTDDGTYTYSIRETQLKGGHNYALALRVGAATVTDAIGSTSSNSRKSLSVDPIPYSTYTGSEIHPAITVRDNDDKVLTEDTDYKLIYSNAVSVGRATVIVVGLGEYLGCVTTAYFNIGKAEGTIGFTSPSAEVTWWQGITFDDNPIVLTGDGTVTYSTEDTDIISIDPETGVVTPYDPVTAPRTATITATVTDSRNYYYPTPTASYMLTVYPRTGIGLDNNIQNWGEGSGTNGTVEF